MPNIVLPNTLIAVTNEKFQGIWKLTRGLLAAGWRYKGSSDGVNTKDTTGNDSKDFWSVGGFMNLTTLGGQTGTAASLTTVTNSIQTVTGLTGMTANSVGHALTISGAFNTAANQTNNGTYRIVTFLSSSSVTIYNPSGVATDAANGAIVWAEKAGGVVANITTVLNGVATLTGLTGMTPASVGHRITIVNAASGGNNGTFMVVAYVSATSVQVLNPSAVATDANNGSIHWMERDPALDTYPSSLAIYNSTEHGAGAWLNLQGPSTMKFPIGTANPSPAFTRGEKVTQAATGCEGEFMGAVIDTTGGTGYIVVAPRVNGSGANARGWDASAIAAAGAPAGSGATVTPSAAGIEYIREMVWWKSLSNQGHIYYQCIDQLGEGTSTATTGRFSTMSALAGCTSTICPGGATGLPTVNGFPTVGTLVATGTGGSGAVATGSGVWDSITAQASGMIQVICANCIEGAGVSQDGSWSLLMGTVATSATSFNLNGFLRCDDGEEGDVDPYVLFFPTNTAVASRIRTANATASSLTGDWAHGAVVAPGINQGPYIGFRRRGFATGDSFTEFGAFVQNLLNSAAFAQGTTPTNPETIACTFVSPPPRVREPYWVCSYNVNQKMRKGTIRWWYACPGGNCMETIDGRRWVQFSSQMSASTCSTVIGPWDTVTIPSQS